jgi:protein-L-isoaspartate(D-aspartate) O-methyltransferase
MGASGLSNYLKRQGVLKTPLIVRAFQKIDRADFVPQKFRESAYLDEALPIGFGQTISQPYVVAFMLELLQPKEGEKILDVGSGSGWTTALLAEIVGKEGAILGTEIIPELVEFGKRNISKYDLPHAEITQAGKEPGSLERAPFDRILVSAASSSVPEKLMQQLKMGGILVIPVKDAVWKIEKKPGNPNIERFEGFVFVPLVHEE